MNNNIMNIDINIKKNIIKHNIIYIKNMNQDIPKFIITLNKNAYSMQ